MGQTLWLQLSSNGSLSTSELLQRSHVWGPWQHLQRSQHYSENLPENFNLLLLAQDVSGHWKTKKILLRSQQRKKSTIKKTPLVPLPITDRPNLLVHTDLFSHIITADSNKKICYATQMLSQSMLGSRRSPIRLLIRWQMQFTRNGSQSLEFQHRYRLTEAKNLWTNFQQNFFNSSMSATPKHRQLILNAKLNWRFLTKL